MAATGFLTTLPEDGLSANHSSAKTVAGSIISDNQGNIYRYVLIDTSSACATTEGSVCRAADDGTASNWKVTPDYDGGASGATDKVVGVAQSAIDTGNYGFILISGVGEVRTDASVAAGDYLVGHGADHEADTMADGEEEQVFGFALEADSATEPHKALSYVYCL
jgi:hypothetical protein